MCGVSQKLIQREQLVSSLLTKFLGDTTSDSGGKVLLEQDFTLRLQCIYCDSFSFGFEPF